MGFLTSFLLDCCCGGLELDFCRDCILVKGQCCCDDDHLLQWGTRPIVLPGFSIESLESQLSADLPQTIATGNRIWMSSFEQPPRLSLSVIRYNKTVAEQQKVKDALEKGEVTVKVDCETSRG